MILETPANLFDLSSNHWSKLRDRLLTKERAEGLSPFSMKVMFYSPSTEYETFNALI